VWIVYLIETNPLLRYKVITHVKHQYFQRILEFNRDTQLTKKANPKYGLASLF
jgi:hypothetical protein